MHYHFIAIGGAIMHNLALELQANGHQVSGSDDEIFDPAKSRLEKAGLLPKNNGWNSDNIIPSIDAIVLGMHAKADNPELLKAQELGIKIYSFPDFIYEHSKDKIRVVIGGSHGKTTSTAMLMHVLLDQKIDFDYLVGSQIDGFERMVRLSDAKIIIIEGDEYLTSALDRVPKFHKYHPHYSMITGIAWDHINVFPTFEGYVKQFEIFVDMTMPNGHCYLFEEDEHLKKIQTQFNLNSSFYNTPEYKETEDETLVQLEGEEYKLDFFGAHNLQNAAGVQKLSAHLGIEKRSFWSSMQRFSGSARRMEKVVDTKELVVYRDFAHSPSKCKATVQAVCSKHSDRDIIALFELHTYSSLRKDFIPYYSDCFSQPKKSYILFDPHVLELKKMPMLDPAFIEKEIPHVRAFSNSKQLKAQIALDLNTSKPKVLLLMSSGKLGGESFY